MMGGRTVTPALALGGLLVFAAAEAQDYRAGFTAYAGSAAYSDMATGSESPVLLAPGAFLGAQGELWFGRVGARLHGGFASPSLDGDPDTGFGLVAGDIDLVARLRRPRPGLFFQPYAVLGGGAVRYDLGSDSGRVAGRLYDSDPTTRASLVLGLGTDLGSGPVALRIELMDLIGLNSPLSRDDGSRYGPVQHVVLTFGLGVRGGRLGLPPEPVTVAARPPQTGTPGTPPPPRAVPPRTTPPPQTTPPQTTPPQTPPPPEPIAPQRPHEPSQPDDPRPPIQLPVPPKPVPPNPPPDTTLVLPQPDSTETDPADGADPDDGSDADEDSDTPDDDTDDDSDDAPGGVDEGDVVRGRLFAVRIAWDPTSAAEAERAARLTAALEEARVPVLEIANDDDAPDARRRLAALRNAADARILGAWIETTYGLSWGWVHIDKDEAVARSAVVASHAFVDTLPRQPGTVRGNGRGG